MDTLCTSTVTAKTRLDPYPVLTHVGSYSLSLKQNKHPNPFKQSAKEQLQAFAENSVVPEPFRIVRTSESANFTSVRNPKKSPNPKRQSIETLFLSAYAGQIDSPSATNKTQQNTPKTTKIKFKPTEKIRTRFL